MTQRSLLVNGVDPFVSQETLLNGCATIVTASSSVRPDDAVARYGRIVVFVQDVTDGAVSTGTSRAASDGGVGEDSSARNAGDDVENAPGESPTPTLPLAPQEGGNRVRSSLF